MEAHELSGPEHKLERLIFFSDAVFAIAITLLVIDLRAPRLPPHADAAAYGQALLAALPGVGGFAISFFVIGAFWTAHHRAFALARRWDDRLIRPNLTLLFTVAAMPFVTAFMSSNPLGRLPALTYIGWLFIVSLANIRLLRLVTAPPVVAPAVDAALIATVRRRGVAVALGALTAAAGVAVLPYPGIGLALLATMPLWRRVLTAWDARRTKKEDA